MGLIGFLGAVEARVDHAIFSGNFDTTQRQQLLAAASQYRPRTRRNPLGDPLAVFYLIARAHRDELDEQALELGSFCQFYLLALDLLDDVQDDDLSGKPHARCGAGMAVNDALTLLFLGLSALERCMRLEKSPQRRMLYLKIVNRVALTTGRGQHLDLLGAQGARTPEEVLAMQRQKTASLTLICECAALYAGVSDEEREHYRTLGENLSLLVQVLDDVRDFYGKPRSPDLETGKMSYPLACFFESAAPSERERFEVLRRALPDSLRDIRRLLYDAGTLRHVARSLDGFRRAIHHGIAELGEDAATHRVLLLAIDQLVEALYKPKPVTETEALREPRFGWHAHVRRLASELETRLRPLGAPKTPPLVPWHQPQWMYDKARGVIFYPDIEGLPEETLPFQAALLGESDLEKVAQLMWRQAPAVMAHELFHHYRDSVGQLGSDMWHEELVANTLAIAYSARYEPAALAGGVELARRVLSRPDQRLSEQAERVL
ncbi:MAG TPA: polyprenyl synthetase family protein, partial [Polyangiaceae bacterium]|nr:polyprenyl synthetase family protein [Polyangiaceae bacterium]